MTPEPRGLRPNQVLWLSVVVLVVVLTITWILVPKSSAPFIYTYF